MKINKELLDKYCENSIFCVEKHPTEDLYIYGYDSRKPYPEIVWDHFNLNMRGIIIDSSGNIKARAFKKFFTYKEYVSANVIQLSEGNVIKLPNEPFKIIEKVDGTMGLLYWVNDVPHIATQRSFMAQNAQKATKILHEKYSHIFSKLDKNTSYVFEVIFKDSRVMVDYGDSEDLILIGMVDNESGKSLPFEDIGFPIAKDYTKEYAHIQDIEELKQLNIKNLEGFVLSYEKTELMIKVKFPWFDKSHRCLNRMITMYNSISELKKEMYTDLGIGLKKISNLDVWEHLKGNNISDLILKIPQNYYFNDFEGWLASQRMVFEGKFEKMQINRNDLTDVELWEMIRPDVIEYFDINERINTPLTSSVMWKFLERHATYFE